MSRDEWEYCFIYMLRDEKVKRYEKAALLSGYEIYCIVTSVNCHSKKNQKRKVNVKWRKSGVWKDSIRM